MSDSLRALLDMATQRWHEAGRTAIGEFSGNIARDLAALRTEVNAVRRLGGLTPSPILPRWDEEEKEFSI